MSESAKGMNKAEIIKWLVTIGIAVVLALIPSNDIYILFLSNSFASLLFSFCWLLRLSFSTI